MQRCCSKSLAEVERERESNCDEVTVCVCVAVYTLVSSSLSSSGARSAGTVGLRKLLSQTGTVWPTAARPACSASGGRARGASRPAGGE